MARSASGSPAATVNTADTAISPEVCSRLLS